MALIDEVRIFIKAGDGGNGSASMSREKHNPLAGPDGGNGGKGGDVVFKASANLNDLKHLTMCRKQFAENGDSGKKNNMHGKNGKNVIVEIPVGCQIFDGSGDVEIHDFTEDKQEFTVAYGGKGGAGNHCFKSSTNQAPQFAKEGHEGQSGYVYIKMKSISDVGLLGYPNAGKSSFLNAVSNTQQQVADYAFTTISPQLGYVPINYYQGFMIADIPGLVKEANEGKGLGHRFLKHIERCPILLHLIDSTCENPVQSYKDIRKEIELFNPEIAKKEEIVAITKIDYLDDEITEYLVNEISKGIGKKVFAVSSQSGQGIKEIKQVLIDCVSKHKDLS